MPLYEQQIKLLIDMNISPQTVRDLQQAGWVAVRVNDILPQTAPDTVILDWAIEHQYVVVSQDLDFSTLVALSGRAQPSLITVRLDNSAPAVVSRHLLAALLQINNALGQGYAITIQDDGIRMRKLPI